MAAWGSVRAIRVGGIVAVGFLDEQRVIVGSHDGLGVVDAATGALLDRVADPHGDYAWLREDAPAMRYSDQAGHQDIPIAGLWGGALATETDDGWHCAVDETGARLRGPGGVVIIVADDETPRACGFSPGGRTFVFATSPTLHVVHREVG